MAALARMQSAHNHLCPPHHEKTCSCHRSCSGQSGNLCMVPPAVRDSGVMLRARDRVSQTTTSRKGAQHANKHHLTLDSAGMKSSNGKICLRYSTTPSNMLDIWILLDTVVPDLRHQTLRLRTQTSRCPWWQQTQI